MSKESIRQIWASKNPTPLMFVGNTAETREQLINDISKKVMSLIRIPIDGRTPTKSEVLELIKSTMPTEKDLVKIVKPLIPKVKDGDDGKTPTEKELKKIIEPMIPEVKVAVNGKTPSRTELEDIVRPLIVQFTATLPKEPARASKEQVEGIAEPIIRSLITKARKGWFGGGGGGDNVRAGSGIALTTNNIGAKVISATGGFSIITVTGTVDDSNTSFTAASEPSVVMVNGQGLRNTKGVTISGTSITLDSPVGTGGDIYAL